eukprot:TRINITY_DN1896_c0_g5_i1.p1 TRINITY_DN1896_c0_g5~~TRINITY_DN1896_c0_g5_i1.p1  ORF type:complete len:385 (-),score=75.18 TRINITY_DN1896_c0_g5_i1:26-1180(-)
MKFYIHFEGEPEFTWKVMWEDGCTDTVSQLTKKFVDVYNEKHPSRCLKCESVFLKVDSKTLNPEDAATKVISNGVDVFAFEQEQVFTCSRGGCSKEYVESKNSDTACKFHPGPPIFHEGYKGWKCCNVKTTDFDEFLSFEGCAWGRHIPVVKAPKPQPTTTTNNPKTVEVVSTTGGVEVYRNTEDKSTASKSASTSTTQQTTNTPKPEPAKEQPDPPDAVIQVGTSCLHRGCNHRYVDNESRTATCVYHPGVAIFHEGSKGWSCCNKFTLLFDDFLNLEGCTEGLHKFVPEKKAETVNVRHDWYQRGDTITVSFYSKNVSKTESKITFTDKTMNVSIKLADGNLYQKEFNLSRNIIPEQCKYDILSTKVEVVLRKSGPGDWTQL